MSTTLAVQDWGTIDYDEAWGKQQLIQKALIDGSKQEALIFCQHPSVLTYGSSVKLEEVLLTPTSQLEQRQIKIIKTNRGGNITYHGPGQLICYPVLDLRLRKQDVAWYIRTLESCVIDLLTQYNIQAQSISSKTGVWISEQAKICAMGIRISRWCTMHGLAINLGKESEQGFQDIVPCGLLGSKAASIEGELGFLPDRTEVIERACKLFMKRFYQDFHLEVN